MLAFCAISTALGGVEHVEAIESGFGLGSNRPRPGAARLATREQDAGRLLEFERALPAAGPIKVIGVGGGGGNALNTMIASGLARRGVHRGQHRRAGAAPQPGAAIKLQLGDGDHARPRLRRQPRKGSRLRARGARSAARAVRRARHGVRDRRHGRRHRHRRGADHRADRARGRARSRSASSPSRSSSRARCAAATPSAGSTSCTASSTR